MILLYFTKHLINKNHFYLKSILRKSILTTSRIYFKINPKQALHGVDTTVEGITNRSMFWVGGGAVESQPDTC